MHDHCILVEYSALIYLVNLARVEHLASSGARSATKSLNGYTLLLQQTMAARVRLPGESAEGCRKRVFSAVRQKWQSLSVADRAVLTEQAKASNQNEIARRRLEQGQQIAPASVANQRPTAEQQVANAEHQQDALVMARPMTAGPARVNAVAPFQGLGAMGVGDKSHAVSASLVKRLQDENKQNNGQQQFVVNLDRSWRERTRGRVGEVNEFKQTTRMSCHDEFKCAMCCKEIKDGLTQEQVSEQLLTFVSNYRHKFVVNKKNTGPNSLVQYPLLAVVQFFGFLSAPFERLDNLF